MRREIVDLKLEHDVFGIAIVKGDGGPVIDRSDRLYPLALETVIVPEQVAEIIVSIGYMVDIPATISRLMGRIQQGYTMMFTVIGEEAYEIVAENHMGPEHDPVPFRHQVHLGGSDHDVDKRGWRNAAT